MSTKVELLYSLLKYGVQIANTPNDVRRYNLPGDITHLLSKADHLREQSGMLIKDVTEKFIQEHFGLTLGKTWVQRRQANGLLSSPFVILAASLHPSAQLPDQYSKNLRLVYDIYGEYADPKNPQCGQEIYIDLDETKGERLDIASDS